MLCHILRARTCDVVVNNIYLETHTHTHEKNKNKNYQNDAQSRGMEIPGGKASQRILRPNCFIYKRPKVFFPPPLDLNIE